MQTLANFPRRGSTTGAPVKHEDGSGLRKCRGIMMSADSIGRLRRGKPVMTVSRERIVTVKLCNDTGVKHPFCRFLLGFFMMMLGVIGGLLSLVCNLKGLRLASGTAPDSFFIPLVTVGFWLMTGAGLLLLIRVFQARYHLLIETKRGITRIFFEEPAGLDEICQFLTKARGEFGYEFDLSEIGRPPSD